MTLLLSTRDKSETIPVSMETIMSYTHVLNSLVEQLDFDKIAAVMTEMKWHWGSSTTVPTELEMQASVDELLTVVYSAPAERAPLPHQCSSGGFTVEKAAHKGKIKYSAWFYVPITSTWVESVNWNNNYRVITVAAVIVDAT